MSYIEMKTSCYIFFACVLLALLSFPAYGTWLRIPAAHADDFVDDIYYTPSVAIQRPSDQPIKPTYDKRVREIVFIEDTVPTQGNDTVVRAIIRE